MIVIHAVFPIDSDSRDQALDQFRTLAEQSRTEDGILDYRVTTDIEQPNQVRIFEQYEDEAAFGSHGESDHFQAFEEQLPEFLAGEPTVTRFDVDSASDLDL